MEDFISCKKGGKEKASFFGNNKDGIVKNQCVVSFFNFEDFLSHKIYLRLLWDAIPLIIQRMEEYSFVSDKNPPHYVTFHCQPTWKTMYQILKL